MRIISPIAIEVLLGALVLVYAQEPTTEAIQPYEFGFNDGLSTRQEQQTADGVVKGSYSYIDAYGEVQKVSYSADAVNGYVVHTDKDSQKVAIPTAATNLDKTKFIQTINEGPKKPVEISKIEVVDGHVVDTPEVAAAKALHFKAFREAEATAANDEKPEKPILRKVPAVVQPKFAAPQKTLVKTLDSVHQNAIPQVRFSPVNYVKQVNVQEDSSIYTPEVAAAREEHFNALRAAEKLAQEDNYVEPSTTATPIIVPNDNGVYTPEVQAARNEHFRAVQQAEQQQAYVVPTMPTYVAQPPQYTFVPPTPAAYSSFVQPTSGYVQPTMYVAPNSAFGLAARVNQYQTVPQGQQTYQNFVPQGYRNAYTPLTIFYKK